MKNLFSKFFGSKNLKNEVMSQPQIEVQAGNLLVDKPIARELFVDDEIPGESSATPFQRKSIVAAFSQLDHYSLGIQDGYNQHSAEFMRKQINSMAATFRRLLHEEGEELRNLITELKMNLAQIGEQFPEIKMQLLLRIEEHQSKIDSFQREAQESVELEGLIGSPVKAYEAGFEVGLKQYLDEKGFLNSFTL